MSLIGQPKSYSDMLKRIFWATFAVGVVCTLAVTPASPLAYMFFESWDTKISIAILDSIKAWYVLIPLLIAILSRVFLLHDKVSDLLRIRRRFDLEHILRPLADGVGFPTMGVGWKQIEQNRKLAMTRTFYRYASFRDPKIDVQLVRTAADRWAWFWCTVEPLIILVVAGIIMVVLGAWSLLCFILSGMVVLILISLLLWPQLRAGARNQVAEILHNDGWRAEVRSALDHIAAGKGRPFSTMRRS
jgi:hypothetical protein